MVGGRVCVRPEACMESEGMVWLVIGPGNGIKDGGSRGVGDLCGGWGG